MAVPILLLLDLHLKHLSLVYRKHSGGLEELNVEQEAAESDSEDLTGDVLCDG